MVLAYFLRGTLICRCRVRPSDRPRPRDLLRSRTSASDHSPSVTLRTFPPCADHAIAATTVSWPRNSNADNNNFDTNTVFLLPDGPTTKMLEGVQNIFHFFSQYPLVLFIGEKKNGIRTWNLSIRSRTPLPFGPQAVPSPHTHTRVLCTKLLYISPLTSSCLTNEQERDWLVGRLRDSPCASTSRVPPNVGTIGRLNDRS